MVVVIPGGGGCVVGIMSTRMVPNNCKFVQCPQFMMIAINHSPIFT